MKREMIETMDKPASRGQAKMEAAGKTRRYPIGAEPIGPGQTHFRVWAPKVKEVEVLIKSAGGENFHPLEAEESGYFSGSVRCGAGALYKFRLDGGEAYPDPASRYQPDGPHGFSCVVDPSAFRWTDERWPGIQMAGQITYE